MYSVFLKKLILFKYIYIILRFLMFFILFLIFIFLIFKIIFIENIYKNYNSSININNEIILKPILQINDKNNNLTYIVSDSGLIQEKYTKLTLNNTKINNDFFESYSKKIIYYNNEIILKERPNIIFYNNYK